MPRKSPRAVLHVPVHVEPVERAIPRPLGKQELAEYFGYSVRFIEAEVKAGKLRAHIVGKARLLFLPKDVDAWLKANPTIPYDKEAV